jgi:signal transduction histidine kinase
MTALPEPAGGAEARIHDLERELGDFAYIVSHDLAASFRHVRGFSELLKQDAGAGLTPEQWSYCAQINGAAEKCAAMLEQLLIYSRANRKPMDVVECSVPALLDTVRLQLGEQVRLSGAQIVTGPLGSVAADPELLVQALKCVIDNAIKFHREGVAPRVLVEQEEDGRQSRITITDNGIGAHAVAHERLFGMFYRAHPEAGYPGCGAGLAIARRILRRHGGEVQFRDWPDGARVEICLPRNSLH